MPLSWARVPQDYGAVGDGGTDDTAAWQGLFADAAAEEGNSPWLREPEIIVPTGTYLITAALTLAASVSVICMPGVILDCQFAGASSPAIDWVISSGNTRVFRPRWHGGRIKRDSATGPALRLRGAEHALLTRMVLERCDPYLQIDSPGSVATESVLVQLCEGVAGGGSGATVGVEVGQTGGSGTHFVKIDHSAFAGAGAGAVCTRFRNGEDCESHFVYAAGFATHTACEGQTRFVITNPSGSGISTFLTSDSGSSGCAIGRSISAPGSGTWAVRGV